MHEGPDGRPAFVTMSKGAVQRAFASKITLASPRGLASLGCNDLEARHVRLCCLA